MSIICKVESVGAVGTVYVQVRLRRPWQESIVAPGQYIKVNVGDQVAYLAIVNYQESDRHFDVLVAPSDNVAVRALRQASVGESFEVSGPLGNGFPDPLEDGYVLVAGGSGISALFPVIEYSACNDVPCRMVYYDRTGRFAYSDLMTCLSDGEIQIVKWDTNDKGRPSDPLSPLGKISDLARRRLCVCGPKSLSVALVESVRHRGLDRDFVCTNY